MTIAEPDKLRGSLMRHEGIRALPYKDSTGHLTIGVGHNLEQGLPPHIIEALLDYDVAAATKWVTQELPWTSSLDDVRARVFVELAFNLGPKLLEFKDALRYSAAGMWVEATAAFLDSLWAKQVGQRAVTLMTMLETGQDPLPSPPSPKSL